MPCGIPVLFNNTSGSHPDITNSMHYWYQLAKQQQKHPDKCEKICFTKWEVCRSAYYSTMWCSADKSNQNEIIRIRPKGEIQMCPGTKYYTKWVRYHNAKGFICSMFYFYCKRRESKIITGAHRELKANVISSPESGTDSGEFSWQDTMGCSLLTQTPLIRRWFDTRRSDEQAQVQF